MIEGILFDFFGTLVAYSPSRVEQGYGATHKLLLDHGIDISYQAFLEAWVAVSTCLDQWSHRTQREYAMEQVAAAFLARVAPSHHHDCLSTHLWRSYVREWSVAIRYLPGVRELIQDLSARFRLGVVSNTHYAPLIHQHLRGIGIDAYCRVVVTSVEHGRPKPHPSIFAAALERLGCSAASTLFVGDAYEADYLGAKQVGMPALLIDPAGIAPAPPQDIIGSVLDVNAHVDRIRP